MSWAEQTARGAGRAGGRIVRATGDALTGMLDALASEVWAIVGALLAAGEHGGRALGAAVRGDGARAGAEAGAARRVARALLAAVTLGLLGVVAIGVVHGVSWVQRLLGLQAEPRGLEEAEVARLRPIFEAALDYAAIRVVVGPLGLLGVGGRPYTLGTTLFVPAARGVASALPAETLVHEATHVWQYEHGGPAYLVAALWAQATGGIGELSSSRGYDFDNALRRGKAWVDFNPEQQAELLEYAYHVARIDFGTPATGRLVLGGVDYLGVLVAALAVLRQRPGAS